MADQQPAQSQTQNFAVLAVISLGCFTTGAIVFSVFANSSYGDALTAPTAANAPPEDRFDVNVPSPDLSPEDVVRMQVQSMRAGLENNEALLDCYSLASPTNRKHTGPFDHFSYMILSPPYSRLATDQSWQMGEAVVIEDDATVLVTSMQEGNQMDAMAYRFFLRRQTAEPYVDCWMTEAVQVHVIPSSESPKASRVSRSQENNIEL